MKILTDETAKSFFVYKDVLIVHCFPQRNSVLGSEKSTVICYNFLCMFIRKANEMK